MLSANFLGIATGAYILKGDAVDAAQTTSAKIPKKWPKGSYEVVVAFFDSSKPIMDRADAFLDASETFTVQ